MRKLIARRANGDVFVWKDDGFTLLQLDLMGWREILKTGERVVVGDTVFWTEPVTPMEWE